MKAKLLLLVFGFIIATNVCASAASKDRVFTFGVHISSVGGLSSAELFELIQKICDLMGSEYGVKVKPVKFSTEEEFVDAFVQNKIDVGSLFPAQIARAIDESKGVYPLATYRIGKTDRISQCLWRSKDLKMKSIEDVRGKTVIRQDLDPYPYVQLRDYLYSKGIDQPLWKVFGGFITVPSSNSAFMAIAIGEGDFHWAPNELKVPMKMFLPNVMPNVLDDYCTAEKFGRPIVSMNKATVTEEEFNQFKSAMKQFVANLDKYAAADPYFKMLQQYMKLGDVHVVSGAMDMISEDVALYNKAKKNGWLKEADFLIDNLKNAPSGTKVEIKMDFKMCKASCADRKEDAQITCIDDCIKN